MCFQDELNSLVFWAAGGVARSSQNPLAMLLARALPAAQNPARLKLTLKANWNYKDTRVSVVGCPKVHGEGADTIEPVFGVAPGV